mgnify:FL=1
MVQAYYKYPIWCESKRAMSEAQEESYCMGETADATNTQQMNNQGGQENGNAGK